MAAGTQTTTVRSTLIRFLATLMNHEIPVSNLRSRVRDARIGEEPDPQKYPLYAVAKELVDRHLIPPEVPDVQLVASYRSFSYQPPPAVEPPKPPPFPSPEAWAAVAAITGLRTAGLLQEFYEQSTAAQPPATDPVAVGKAWAAPPEPDYEKLGREWARVNGWEPFKRGSTYYQWYDASRVYGDTHTPSNIPADVFAAVAKVSPPQNSGRYCEFETEELAFTALGRALHVVQLSAPRWPTPRWPTPRWPTLDDVELGRAWAAAVGKSPAQVTGRDMRWYKSDTFGGNLVPIASRIPLVLWPLPGSCGQPTLTNTTMESMYRPLGEALRAFYKSGVIDRDVPVI